MKWLTAIVEGIAKALLSWAQGQAEKPTTIKDANTPKTVGDQLSDAADKWMRDKERRDS